MPVPRIARCACKLTCECVSTVARANGSRSKRRCALRFSTAHLGFGFEDFDDGVVELTALHLGRRHELHGLTQETEERAKRLYSGDVHGGTADARGEP